MEEKINGACDKENRSTEAAEEANENSSGKINTHVELTRAEEMPAATEKPAAPPEGIAAQSETEETSSQEDTLPETARKIEAERRINEKYTYKAMSDKTARIIRWSVGAALLIGFAIFMILKFKVCG